MVQLYSIYVEKARTEVNKRGVSFSGEISAVLVPMASGGLIDRIPI